MYVWTTWKYSITELKLELFKSEYRWYKLYTFSIEFIYE